MNASRQHSLPGSPNHPDCGDVVEDERVAVRGLLDRIALELRPATTRLVLERHVTAAESADVIVRRLPRPAAEPETSGLLLGCGPAAAIELAR